MIEIEQRGTRTLDLRADEEGVASLARAADELRAGSDAASLPLLFLRHRKKELRATLYLIRAVKEWSNATLDREGANLYWRLDDESIRQLSDRLKDCLRDQYFDPPELMALKFDGHGVMLYAELTR